MVAGFVKKLQWGQKIAETFNFFMSESILKMFNTTVLV